MSFIYSFKTWSTKVKGLEMKYIMIKVLEDLHYNIFYNRSILYNVPKLFINDVEDASHCLFSFLTLTF